MNATPKRDEYATLVDENQRLTEQLVKVRSRMAELYPFDQAPYRIALRPDVSGADPFDHRTLCDDIVVNTVPMFRAEQMDTKNWWVCCYLDEDTSDRICWSVTARSKPLRLEWVTTEFPLQHTVYEHDVRTKPTRLAIKEND